MLTKEDLQQLSDLMDQKLDQKLNPIKEDIRAIKEDIEVLKEDLQDATDKINMMSEWIEAASEYHIHEIHYPLDPDEKLKYEKSSE